MTDERYEPREFLISVATTTGPRLFEFTLVPGVYVTGISLLAVTDNGDDPLLIFPFTLDDEMYVRMAPLSERECDTPEEPKPKHKGRRKWLQRKGKD